MIYLDNAATTKMAPEVYKAMHPYLIGEYGNPGSLHKMGRDAAQAIAVARAQTAELFNCTPEHVIFTSGGSEGNSMVFNGVKGKLLAEGKNHIVVSAVEHDSVIRSARSLIKDGFYLDFVRPNPRDCVGYQEVLGAIRENTGLVSVMAINNETGIANPINAIGILCKKNGIYLHSDCVQIAGQMPIDVEKWQLDFATISAHKFCGPKGVGAVYIRDTDIAPLVHGGAEQEFGLRGGTENVAGIVGLGAACELCLQAGAEERINAWVMAQLFLRSIETNFGCQKIEDVGIRVNGSEFPYHILSLTVDGVFGESLVLMMDSMGVCISAGSACRAHESDPSKTLLAYGLTDEEARSTVRVSFSRYSTVEEVEEAAYLMSECIKTLRDVQ